MNGLTYCKEVMDSAERMENDPSGVYSLIRSLEIREFYKNHVKLDILQRGQIILHSYISMQQKIGMLRQLTLYGTEQETKVLNEMCSILEKCMFDIYSPAERTVFVVEYVILHFEEYRIKSDFRLDNFCDTAEDLLSHIRTRYEGSENYAYGYVSLLQLPKSERMRNHFDFTVFWIDGGWKIKDIMLNQKYQNELTDSGFCESAVEQIDYYNLSNFEHFPLPFGDQCRLKLQTPFMKEPVYGILSSECDFIHKEWHHYLWDEAESKLPEEERSMRKCISLIQHELDGFSGFSTLDWLERA